MKQTAVVIFPGRGTYGKDELGYLARHHADKAAFVKGVDDWRAAQGRETVSDLDNAKTYSAAKHASSINASALIYTCALADFAAIDCEKFDIVAVCGNSLGWYLTLAGAGAVNPANAIRLVDTMGALMERAVCELWRFPSVAAAQIRARRGWRASAPRTLRCSRCWTPSS